MSPTGYVILAYGLGLGLLWGYGLAIVLASRALTHRQQRNGADS